MEALSPEDLVRWCQRTLPDDTRAFEQLVARYKAQVYRTAYRLMGNRHDAEDQAQEVFLKVYRSIHDLDDPATVTAWIYRITVNVCLDALDRQKRRPSMTPLTPADADGEEQPGALADTTSTPEEVALRRELQRCIKTVLAQLSAVERAALLLRDLEDRSYQEIADTLKVGLSAAKMRIHRARLAFHQVFERICADLWPAT
jgi:RNA polymerase sigma-70 factor (ECF subfamily)